MKRATVLVLCLLFATWLTVLAVERNEAQRLESPSPTAGEGFGYATVSGDLAVVAAPGWNSRQGRAFVFRRSGGTWVPEGPPLVRDSTTAEFWGLSIAVSPSPHGDVVAGGATFAGAVEIFRKGAGGWAYETRIPSPTGGGFFGAGVALVGDLLVVGSPNDNTKETAAGAVYLYRYDGSAWIQEPESPIIPDTVDYLDQFGTTIDATTYGGMEVFIAGAPRSGAGPGGANEGQTGSAYIYRNAPGGWELWEEITPSAAVPGDFSAHPVAIHEGLAALGSYPDTNANGADAGAVYLYEFDGNSWAANETIVLEPGGTDGNRFGVNLTVGEDLLVATGGGTVQTFVPSGSSWVPGPTLAPSGPAEGFGGSDHETDGGWVFIGAPEEDHSSLANAGAVYAFDLTDLLGGETPTAPAVTLTAFGEEFAVDGDVRGWTTGKPMEFEVVATDANAADTITVEGFLDGVLIPETGPGATLSAPAGANPVSRTFTWTPVQADEGSRSLVFEATDSTGLMTRVTVTVEVVHDSDGDGIPDDWELFGIPYEGDRIPLPGADPDVPDVYVEIDFMGSTDESGGDVGHDHRPLDHALDWIVSSFEDRGIALHLLLDDEIPHRDELGPDPAVYDWPAFDELKSAWFTPGHAAVYRYCLFVHTMGGSDTSGISRNEPDRFELGASDFVVSLGYTSDAEDPPNGTEDEQAGTFMHELGHNLGLHHGGFEDVGYKPNYLSVMNYHFQEGLLVTANLNKQTEHIRFDYSEIRFADLDENLLTESFGIGAGAEYSIYDTWRHYRGNRYREADVSDGIDWNSDGDTLDTVAADVNNGGGKSLLVGHDDWSNLVFTGGAVGARGGVVRLPPTTTGTEQGLTEIRERTPVAPNAYEPVAVVSSASLAPGEDGNAVLTLDGSASSDGDGEELSFVWYVNGEAVATGETATVTLEPGSYEITLVVEDRWYRSETAPLTVAVAGADQDLTASPYWIWPPNGRMVPVTVSTKAEGGTVRVVGVTSNEEIAGDWETTSDPSVVKLRADRDGEGDGRVYTVEVEVTAGSTVYTGWVEVFVGHDQRAKKDSAPPEEETGDAAPAGEEPAPAGEEPAPAAPAPAEETTAGGETSTGDASATGDEAPAGTTGDEPSPDGSADGGTDSGGTDGGAEAPTGSETPEIDGSEDFGEEAGQSSGGTDPDGKKETSGPDGSIDGSLGSE